LQSFLRGEFLGIAKQSNSNEMSKRALKKRYFWIAVFIPLSIIIGFTAIYFPYQSQEQYSLDLKKNQENHQIFQTNIKAEINNQKRSDYVAQIQLNTTTKKSNPTFNSDSDNSQTQTSKPYTYIASNQVKSQTKIGGSQIVLSEFENVSSNEVKVNKLSLNKMFTLGVPSQLGFQSALQNNLLLRKPSTEFSKKKFCQQLNYYVGIVGGLDYVVNQRDYTSTVDQQLIDHHYNLDNSKLISSQFKGNKQFNFGVNGGIQLFDKLDIEAGLNYHQSNMEFTSIYQNVFKEEYIYVEWVPTGESGGPNGQPIYEPKDVVDHYYVSTKDTLTTVANNYQLEIPLLFRYNFRFDKLSLFATLGSSAIVYSKYQVKTTNTSTGETIETTNDQTGMVQVNALFGGGISYRVLGNLELKIEPLFRPVIKSQDSFLPGFNSNSTSLNAGLTYRF